MQHWAADGRSIALISGAACAVMGVLVFVLRLADAAPDTAWVPRITTSAMFAVAGLGLVAAALRGRDASQPRAALGSIVLLVALGCLFDRIASGHMSASNDGGAVSPIPTVVAFLLVGVSLVTYGGKRRAWPSYLSAAAVGAIVFTGVTGWAIGLRPGDSVLAGMSPTSLVFLGVMTVGLLSLWPELPPFSWLADRTSGGRLALRLVPVMVALPLLLAMVIPHWQELTGLPDTAGLAVAVAILATVLTGLTAISVRQIDRAELLADQVRRDADAAVRASERQFRTLAVEMPAGVISRDQDGTITFANDEAYRIFGLAPGDDLHSRATAMAHPDDLASARAAMQHTMETSEPYEQETRIILESGETRWVHVRGTRQNDDDGNFVSYLSMITDVTERHDYQRKLEHLAHHDPLTTLLNRRAFEARLAEHTARVARYGPTGAVLMIDLDGFKAVNDTLGHAAGDALIAGVAGALRERLRETDVVARLGGDEFAVILPEESGARALEVAECLLSLIRENAAAFDHGQSGSVSASIGVADFAAGVTADEMLHRADLAMYQAKETGKSRVVAHSAAASAKR